MHKQNKCLDLAHAENIPLLHCSANVRFSVQCVAELDWHENSGSEYLFNSTFLRVQ